MQPWQLSLPKHNAWLRVWAVPTNTASGLLNYTNLQGVHTDTEDGRDPGTGTMTKNFALDAKININPSLPW